MRRDCVVVGFPGLQPRGSSGKLTCNLASITEAARLIFPFLPTWCLISLQNDQQHSPSVLFFLVSSLMLLVSHSLTALFHQQKLEQKATLSSTPGLLAIDDDSDTLSARTTPTHYLKTIAFALLPSPLQRRLAPSHFKAARLHPTAYLDGLRGLASPSVCLLHYT